jgi:iron complex outermembrane receptor protein
MLLATFISLTSSRPAKAQQKEGSEAPMVLEAVTIEAAPVQAEETEPSFLTVIQGKDLERRFTSVPEALSETVGVRVNRFGGLGDFSTISIRGSSSEQVLIYVDGILLNEAQGGGVNIGTIPISNIESIEIYRGSSPIEFGQAGIGGVVNIKTRSAREKRILSTQAQYGSFDTYRVDTFLSDKSSRLDYVIGLNYTGSNNNFKFLDDNGTQYDSSDDVIIRRLNNQFGSFNWVTKLGYDLNSNTRISVFHNLLDTDKGIPGLGSFQSLHAHFKTREYRTGLELARRAALIPQLDLHWTFHHTYKKEAFEDRLGEIGVGNQDNENITESYETRLDANYWLGEHQLLNGLLTMKVERFTPYDHLQGSEVATSRRKTFSVGVEDKIVFMNDKLFLVPGVLYDMMDNTFHGEAFLSSIGQDISVPDRQWFLTRQIGVLYQVTDPLEIRANIGRYFRPPNFFELFGDRGGTVGDPELLPEESLNQDVGFKYERRPGSFMKEMEVQATYFHNRVENLILFIQTSQRTSKPENIGRAEITGQELVGRMQLGNHFKISGNYTYQRAVNRSNIPSQTGKILPGRPLHEFSGKAEFFSDTAALFYSYDFTAKNFLDRVNQLPTHSRNIHNIGISVTPRKSVSASFEVKNITDSRIEDIFGFPLPGRSYFLTVNAHF